MPKKIAARPEGFNPFGDLIGLAFTRCENGVSRCVLNINEQLLNPHKTLHGGVAYAMADTGMGGALYTCMKENELCATIEIKIVYFKAVSTGTLTCDTRVINMSKRIATMESEIRQKGDLVAKALGTYSIFKIRGRTGSGEDEP